MAASTEEHLLNELLLDLRTADEHVDAADLEARVVAAFTTTVRLKPDTTYPDTTYYYSRPRVVAVISGVATAVLIAVVLSMLSQTESEPLPVVRPPVRPAVSINKPVEIPDTLPNVQSATTAQLRPPNQSPVTPSPVEFIPIVPLTEHELAGSFQIVRVQMPRASLGALTSPFEHPGEFVEADVLLGEDGMARAIRVSTNESVYPWRSQ